jgi:hypothetical protein
MILEAETLAWIVTGLLMAGLAGIVALVRLRLRK